MKSCVMPVIVLLAALGGVAAAGADPSPFETGSAPPSQGPIDKLVFGKLQQLGIPPANLCSDAVFVRRVYLDAIGTLPTAEEVKAFLADKSPGKRAELIDRLLERPEFADYWAMKWSDLLRVNAAAPINLWPNAAQAYHRWIRTSIRDNVPYDRFVREMLTASGSNFRVPPVNFYRAVTTKDPASIAKAVALTLMGERAERWPKERLAGMAALFSQIGYKSTLEWKEEIVFRDFNKAGAPTSAVFPDGTAIALPAGTDPRIVFADWLVTPKNAWFTRNIANRVWSWLVGRGIVHEPDDIRPDNPPVSPELLALLEKELVAAQYDLKRLYCLILNSQTYQLSSVPQSDKPEAAANFACYPLRRLEAEVLIDALNQISGTTEKYSSRVPEPYTWFPESQRAVALPCSSLTSPFLQLFGRPARATGLESERDNRISDNQRLHLLNSNHIRNKVQKTYDLRVLPRVKPPAEKGKASAAETGVLPQEIVAELYLTILSRYPTDDELKIVETSSPSTSAKEKAPTPTAAERQQAVLIDLIWALFNSREFLYRH
ncbi:MAG: DUF1553 domain-containing protein [Thermoguttaceae bacterium]|jgi:hypothetical protein